MILDVLIIGGGPHALTLASLLSHPEADLNSDPEQDSPLSVSCSDPPEFLQPNRYTFNNKAHSGKRKRKITNGIVCLSDSLLLILYK